jgi:hypothetical protein
MPVSRPILIALAVVGVLGGVAVIRLFPDSADDKTLKALREEGTALERKLAHENGSSPEPHPPTGQSENSPSPVPLPDEFVELAARLDSLATAVSRLEEVTHKLEDRISRSALALYRFEDAKTRSVPMREGLLQSRQSFQEDYVKVSALAAQLVGKVSIEFTDPNQPLPPSLADQPTFMAELGKLRWKHRLLQAQETAFQKFLGTTDIGKSVESLNPGKDLPPLPIGPPLGGDPEDATFPLERLSAAVSRLEIVVRDLTQRLARAQMVLPNEEEKRVILGQMQTETQNMRQSFQKEVSEVMRLAGQLNVTLSEDEAIVPNTPLPPHLANDPRFKAVRTRMLLHRDILYLSDQLYNALKFEWR